MSSQLHKDMTAVLEDLRYDDEARVVVLAGVGKAFCAGMDLKQFFIELNENRAEYDRILRWRWNGAAVRCDTIPSPPSR